MSDLPQGWEWSTIGDVAEVNPVMSKSSLSDEDLVTFVPMASVAVESGMMDASDVQVAGPLKKKGSPSLSVGE